MLLSKGKKIKHICLPGELSDNVKPIELKDKYVGGFLDPVRLGRQELEELFTDLGTYGYSGQVEQSPAPYSGGIFKKDWFKIISRQDFEDKVNPSRLTVNFYIDTAYTEDTTNDPTGLYASVIHDNKTYILDAKNVFKEHPDLMKEIPLFAAKNRYTSRSLIKVEPKASGLSVIQSMKTETKLNVMAYKFAKEKGITGNDSKEVRARAVSPIAETGRVFLVEGEWNQDFIDQCATFPRAAHDEMVDCLVMDLAENLLFKKKSRRMITINN